MMPNSKKQSAIAPNPSQIQSMESGNKLLVYFTLKFVLSNSLYAASILFCIIDNGQKAQQSWQES